jgi:hypothetical protein
MIADVLLTAGHRRQSQRSVSCTASSRIGSGRIAAAASASSDALRTNPPLQDVRSPWREFEHPSWADTQIGWQLFPAEIYR